MLELKQRAAISLIGVAALASCGQEAPTPQENAGTLEVSATPPGGVFSESIDIELQAERPAEIFYTLDGSVPTSDTALVYGEPIEINERTLLSYIAIGSDGVWSTPRTEFYSPVIVERAPKIIPRVLTVRPDVIFFMSESGHPEPISRTIQVRSAGLQRVHVKSVYLGSSPDGASYFDPSAFDVSPKPEGGFYLWPGETREYTVTYKPTSTLRSAALVFESDEESSAESYKMVKMWGRIGPL